MDRSKTNIFPAAAALLLCLGLILACGGSKAEETGNSNSKDADKSLASAGPSPDDYPTPADTSPATVSASTIIAEAKSSDTDKYLGRLVTVTDGELWEIMYSHVKIGRKYGTYSDGYIICNGSFSDYTPYAGKIADMEKAGKSPGATVKGKFSRVVTDMGYTQVHLDPCVLSDLEK
jgi:hypothetical protein